MLTHYNNLNTGNNSRGFSLIELMFALLIGLVITGGVFSLYSTTRDTQRSSQEQLQLVADARFALNTLAYDIRHSGSWGSNNNWQTIYCNSADTGDCLGTSITTATGDCGTRWYTTLSTSLEGSDDVNPFGGTCATVDYQAGTDVLGVKYADSTPLTMAQLAADVAYIRSNIQTGQLFIGTAWQDFDQYKFANNAQNNTVTRNHRLVARAYYVSGWTDVPGDGWPSLRRVDLGPGPQMTSAVLVPGVQDMQLEFGVDTNTKADGIINTYVSAGNIPNDSSGNPNWNRVHAVKVWLLMRSQRPDRDGISGTQTFTIAGKPAVSFNDGYHRMLVSSLIFTRN